jgi:hypothetical protein
VFLTPACNHSLFQSLVQQMINSFLQILLPQCQKICVLHLRGHQKVILYQKEIFSDPNLFCSLYFHSKAKIFNLPAKIIFFPDKN